MGGSFALFWNLEGAAKLGLLLFVERQESVRIVRLEMSLWFLQPESATAE